MATETLDARLSKVMFHKPSRFSRAGEMFLIARTNSGSTVKGSMSQPVEGELYRFYGEWRPQKGRDDVAFEFGTYEVMIDQSPDGLTHYLSVFVKGLGPARSRAIVEHFGEDTIKILETDPGRAVEVPGITDAVAEGIRKHFESRDRIDPVAFAALSDLFNGHRIPRKVVENLAKDHGRSAVDMVRKFPYGILLNYPRMGWKTVDALALSALGYDPAGIDRQRAAILEGLTRVANDGHTWAYKADVASLVHGFIGMRPDEAAWKALDENEDIYLRRGEYGDEAALMPLHQAEVEIAQAIDRLTRKVKPLPFALPTQGLSEDQSHAVTMIESNGVSILAGGPGTGKSYTEAAIIAGLYRMGSRSIRVVAPTGKAAKRVAELVARALPGVDIPCTTIHRALAPQPSEEDPGVPSSSSKFGRGRDEFGFGHNEANPLEIDHLFVDETSMVDVRLAAALLKATPDGTRVVFIGDPNQLPSVGPGSVLRDMIASGLPCVTLDKIVRSDGGGRVVRACHAIKNGEPAEPAEVIALDTENWVHIERETPEEIAEEIVQMHRAGKRFPDPVWDFQVVTPQRSTAIGTDALNQILSRKLNPSPILDQSDEPENHAGFRVGDKVVRTKNGAVDRLTLVDDKVPGQFRWDGRSYRVTETTVVNGDMGQVLAIEEGPKGWSVVVRFRDPDRLCRLPYESPHLLAAYAMTCHKCQGSGFPFVIVPVHHGFYYDVKADRGLWNREWIYTAISRAEVLLVTVGQFSAIETAVRRKTVHQRNTRLVMRLGVAMPRHVDEGKEMSPPF